MSLHIQLDQFEGPLALLLYLIRKEEMDIYNIPIQRITQQYLEHIKIIKELDLESAGEFVAMAATLIHIKSKMLLPQYNEHGEVVENEDPRRELVQRLLEYQKYQEVAKQLYERPLLGRDTWGRGMREEINLDETGENSEISLEESGLFSLISMYRMVIKKMSKNVHTVLAKGQSIAARIMEIKDRLVMGRRTELKELISAQEYSRNKLLITFLSLLELGRLGFVSLFQSGPYADLYVEVKKPIERDIVSRVDEFEAKIDGVAEQWIAKAEAEQTEEQKTQAEIAKENGVDQLQMNLTDSQVIDSAEVDPNATVNTDLSYEALSKMTFDEMSQVAGRMAREAAEVFEKDEELLAAEREIDLQDQLLVEPVSEAPFDETVQIEAEALLEQTLESVSEINLLESSEPAPSEAELTPAEMLEELMAFDENLNSTDVAEVKANPEETDQPEPNEEVL